jgi:hypothetical protein
VTRHKDDVTKATGRRVVGIKNDPVSRLGACASNEAVSDLPLDGPPQARRGRRRSLAKASASALAQGHSRCNASVVLREVVLIRPAVCKRA